jgi:hypothetical protein
MTHQGTSGLLDLAAKLKTTAPHVESAFDLRLGAHLMLLAANALERVAPLEPDIDVQQGEN